MLRVCRIPYSTNIERVALALAHKGLEVEGSTSGAYNQGQPSLASLYAEAEGRDPSETALVGFAS